MTQNSLKAKAKTTRQIISEYVGTDKWKLDAYIKPDFKPAEKQWVPLLDAEKVEKQLELACQNCDELEEENKQLRDDLADAKDSNSELFISEQNYQTKSSKLEGRIAEANKILNVIIGKCQDNNGVYDCEKCCDKKCCEEYDLRAALNPEQKEAKQ